MKPGSLLRTGVWASVALCSLAICAMIERAWATDGGGETYICDECSEEYHCDGEFTEKYECLQANGRYDCGNATTNGCRSHDGGCLEKWVPGAFSWNCNQIDDYCGSSHCEY